MICDYDSSLYEPGNPICVAVPGGMDSTGQGTIFSPADPTASELANAPWQ